MNNIDNIAFLGLGVMGFPMAGHLSKKSGAGVTVYNRTKEKADKWLGIYAGEKALTPAEAVRGADLILCCVGNDDDLRELLTGKNGVAEGVQEGAIIVDHTTVSASISREMATFFEKKGCTFLDAPVSGGQAGAENGQLSVMVGGNEDAFARVKPLLEQCYAKEIRHLGKTCSGQLAKMVNQICIAGVIQGLSEGLAFGMKAGLDMEEVLAVIGKGAAQSWQMDNRGSTMIKDEFDFGFAVDWMIKDLKIAIEEGLKNGANLTVTNEIFEFYKELQNKGHGRLDTSSLIKRLTSSL